ncbi:unnamed protein product [Paramecium sonneborni]|uniref:Uncharacterized protein n=1 Tax=Paramecium sonneborni TaxID=65129 RepID=A0A8S1QJH5_9CILI|nr:unnamed protein product [Paramecium sonneborni]
MEIIKNQIQLNLKNAQINAKLNNRNVQLAHQIL